MTTLPLAELARTFADSFTVRLRAPKTRITVLKDSAPAWCQMVARVAHQDGAMLPDDVRFEMMAKVAPLVADAVESGSELTGLDDLVSIYTSDLLAWVASHPERLGYLDEALGLRDRFAQGAPGGRKGAEGLLAQAQLLEYEEIAAAILRGLRTVATGKVKVA